jgi:lipopolysaccharide/colanic/teichoic acid biosynthesis glycosyltransferase
VLPAKMYYNLKAIEKFSFWGDIKIMFMTVFAVLGKEYKGELEASSTKISVETAGKM